MKNMLIEMGFRRGVNLGGWLSQCNYSPERLNHFIEAEDIARIAGWGVDHIRIPVDYNVFENAAGELVGPGFERLDWALGECDRHGLKAVIDLHKTAGYSFNTAENEGGFFNSAEYQERFFRLWEELARRYGDRPDRIVFELLNEVTDKAYMDSWNCIIAEAVRRIRAFAPDTVILVGSHGYNSARAVRDLAAPADNKVVYNFHCYEKHCFTHQGATWGEDPKPDFRISFADADITEEMFEELFADAIAAAERMGTSLYCGEYGVIDNAEPRDALEWFRTINAVLERHSIPRAVWSYKQMNFGISDARWDELRGELIKYL